MFDLIIIGGGPGGVAAGIYAARKKLKTLLVTDFFGGQSLVSLDVRNFIGVPSISGYDLAVALEKHLRVQEDIEVVLGDKVSSVKKLSGDSAAGFKVKTEGGKEFETRVLLLTAGSVRRRLGIPGEKEFEGRGVAYCATCDAPLFKGKHVAVVGGGNSALEGVRDLIPHASEITLFVRSEIKGDPVTLEKISRDPKVKILKHAEIEEIKGENTVQKIRFRLNDTGEKKETEVDGIFIEIGWQANSSIVKGLAEVNAGGEIVVDHKTQKTSCDGLWAAGDVTDALYKQNNISMGDAIKAVLNINDYLHSL